MVDGWSVGVIRTVLGVSQTSQFGGRLVAVGFASQSDGFSSRSTTSRLAVAGCGSDGFEGISVSSRQSIGISQSAPVSW